MRLLPLERLDTMKNFSNDFTKKSKTQHQKKKERKDERYELGKYLIFTSRSFEVLMTGTKG